MTAEKDVQVARKKGRGGEVIWAMPERKHLFLYEVFPKGRHKKYIFFYFSLKRGGGSHLFQKGFIIKKSFFGKNGGGLKISEKRKKNCFCYASPYSTLVLRAVKYLNYDGSELPTKFFHLM